MSKREKPDTDLEFTESKEIREQIVDLIEVLRERLDPVVVSEILSWDGDMRTWVNLRLANKELNNLLTSEQFVQYCHWKGSITLSNNRSQVPIALQYLKYLDLTLNYQDGDKYKSFFENELSLFEKIETLILRFEYKYSDNYAIMYPQHIDGIMFLNKLKTLKSIQLHQCKISYDDFINRDVDFIKLPYVEDFFGSFLVKGFDEKGREETIVPCFELKNELRRIHLQYSSIRGDYYTHKEIILPFTNLEEKIIDEMTINVLTPSSMPTYVHYISECKRLSVTNLQLVFSQVPNLRKIHILECRNVIFHLSITHYLFDIAEIICHDVYKNPLYRNNNLDRMIVNKIFDMGRLKKVTTYRGILSKEAIDVLNEYGIEYVEKTIPKEIEIYSFIQPIQTKIDSSSDVVDKLLTYDYKQTKYKHKEDELLNSIPLWDLYEQITLNK